MAQRTRDAINGGGDGLGRDEGYQRFVAALASHGYRSTWQLGSIKAGMTIDCYIGGGKHTVLLVRRDWSAGLNPVLIGWDVYRALTDSNKVDDTIDALTGGQS